MGVSSKIMFKIDQNKEEYVAIIFYDDNTWCILKSTEEFASGTYPASTDTTENVESFTATVTALSGLSGASLPDHMNAVVSITDSATNLSVTIDLSSMGMGEQTFKFTRI